MNPGESIGPYVVDSALGTGGMGRVYRARDTRLGRDVALKQLSDSSLTSDIARRRVLQEARAAAGLSHPNIATIFDVLDTAEGPTIVMEYVPGESLARHIARGALPVARALEIALHISDALIDAHAHGIVHRDLKPANIQITPEGKVKILDFGIARLVPSEGERASATTVTSSTEAGRLVGTPGYMAPEQLGGGPADARTDIYGVGVLLYEMLAGCRPFPAEDLLGSAMAVLKGGAPPVSKLVPGIPPLVSALVERAMEREASERFQTAGELSRELQRARLTLAAEPAAALPSDVGVRRKPARWAAAAIAAVILTGVGWQWVRGSGEQPVFAVLPFRNMTADASNDSIAVGLTDAVANRLSSLQSIRGLSLDASREAVRSNSDAVAAAKTLGAQFVIEGLLRRTDKTLDVDVSLVGTDGLRRHVGRYTGEMAQAFDIHRRIAQGVIDTLAAADAVPVPASPSPPPTSNQQAFAEYAQARLFLERPDVPKNIDHAIQLFQSAIAKDPQFALAHAGLGQAYWAQYRQTQDRAWTDKATAAILEALRIERDQPEVRLSLAVMYQGIGRLDTAEEEVQRVIEKQPWNDDAHRVLAGIHIERSQWDRAVTELRRAIALRPNYWRNNSELGYAQYKAGRLDEALAAYKRVVVLQPDSALGFNMLGTVHQSAGRLTDALANYTDANKLRPHYTTYSNIGTIHFWQGDYAKAADAYEQAIKRAANIAANIPTLHANLGDALQKLGQGDRAWASYRRAVAEVRNQLTVNDRDAINLSRLALYLAKLQDRSGADEAAGKALAVNKEDGTVLTNTAMVDALAGRMAEACAKVGAAVTRGFSRVVIRHSDELRVLKGCEAYDAVLSQ